MSDKVKHYFQVGDMVVFGGNLLVSISIGLYFAFKDRNNSTVANYFFAEKKISWVSLGISLSVSYISAVTIIGLPSESYLYGTVNIWNSFPPVALSIFITCLYYIPMMHRLKLDTFYQFLEMRFHPSLRKLVSGYEVFSLLMYMCVALYAPALALSAVTPISLFWSILLTSGVCTLYTTMGGVKAVIWNDVIQFGIMVVGVVAALIKATLAVGGIGKTWAALERGGRMNFLEFDPDPTIRATFWTFAIGAGVSDLLNVCTNQSVCQRYLSCKSVSDARKAAVTAFFPKVMMCLIMTASGFAAYAYFEGCDPVKLGTVSKTDQIYPYMVLLLFRTVPGMAGLFVAAAYSGTMSTLSSGLNSACAQLLQDFVTPLWPNVTNRRKMIFSKCAVLVFGALVAGGAFLCTFLNDTVIATCMSVKGALGGSILGVYTLGLFLPWCNTKGAVAGQLIGTAFTAWIAIGGIVYGKSPESQRKLPVSTLYCNVTFRPGNMTTLPTDIHKSWNFSATEAVSDEKQYQLIYAVSFWYYAVVGVLVTVAVGLVVSFITGANDPAQSNPLLFSPIIDNHLLPPKVVRFFRFGVPKIQDRKGIYQLTKITDKAHPSSTSDHIAATQEIG